MATNLLSEPISIYALGGLGEVGKNTYCIESQKTLIIIDAGVRFPEETLPGVDYVIPDYTHLKNNRSKIKALFITHGHEDHIGAIPFLIQSVYIPVIYAPKLAAALIKRKLEENRIREQVKIVEYSDDSVIQAGDFKVSFFHVTHSIPDSFGICVDTSEGRICTTGDFKIDLTPIDRDFDLTKVARLGSEGVDLLLSDSTNAEHEGYTPSEKNVISSINEIFSVATGRLIISTFSSNLSRIQQIVEASLNFKRKIAIVGRSMENVVSAARAFGYIHIPETSIIRLEDISRIRNNELVILCTGSQGEPMAALARIANGEHKQLHIIPGDTVVFSSSPIPGNGGSINRVVNQLVRNGATVLTNSVFSDIHSSGHPSRQELRLLLKLMKPNYFMPAHGEYRMLKLHGELAESLGIPKDHIFIQNNGDVLLLKNHKVKRGINSVPAEPVYIDGKDINGLSAAVIRDRKILNDDGMVSVLIVLDSKKNVLLTDPKIYTRGFVHLGINELIPNAERRTKEILLQTLQNKSTFSEIKNTVKTNLGKYLYFKTQRSPMIIPVIMDKN